MDIKGLVAYPSSPSEIGMTISESVKTLRDNPAFQEVSTWEENDIAGHCLIDPTLKKIEEGNVLIADITRLNFNVVYEIGYAIGRKKRVILIKNSSVTSDDTLIREIGIFDTLGYHPYQNSSSLVDFLAKIENLAPMNFDPLNIKSQTPVYILLPRQKTDAESQIISRVTKAKLHFRSFDPEEQGRLSALEAIQNVAISHGVVVPLISSNRVEEKVHNPRAAFVAGLAHGMEKRLLLLQFGDDPVPLDLRDAVSRFKVLHQIGEHIAAFALDITALLQERAGLSSSEQKTFLARLNIGASSAENEFSDLEHYYLETEEYRRTVRGEVQIVAGRKGAGKTALFMRLRDKLLQNKRLIILDLRPDGFQLLKFKEHVLDILEEGSKEHTITAFWEYLLLLEICHKILEMDKSIYLNNNQLYDMYCEMAKAYLGDDFVSEGDFAERMSELTSRVADNFGHLSAEGEPNRRISNSDLTQLLYKHDVVKLRGQVSDYLTKKEGLWILFDNLDKGWPPHGPSPDDLIMLRCLIDALEKMRRALTNENIECRGVLFIRNDVYELLLENTPDRGKVSRVTLDWTDADLLREMLRKRILFNFGEIGGETPFEEIWREICVSHIGGEESSEYMIDRCAMRPRGLIELLQYCRSHAVNLGHEKIEVDDIRKGEEAYSTDLVANITFEIRDIDPGAMDILYEFIESSPMIKKEDLSRVLDRISIDESQKEKIVDLLLWYGFLGFIRDDGEVAYIYSVKYDMKRLKTLIRKKLSSGSLVYHVNPAFWEGLEIKKPTSHGL